MNHPQLLAETIIAWGIPYRNGPYHGVYEKAVDLVARLKSEKEDVVRRDFEHAQLVEPLQERIELYAQGISGIDADLHAYEEARREWDEMNYDNQPDSRAKRLMQRQIKELHSHLFDAGQGRDRRDRYGMVDNAHQDEEMMQAFEKAKSFIAALKDYNVNPLDVSDAFDSWQRSRHKAQYDGGVHRTSRGKRYLGAGKTYERSFDRGYYTRKY
jgi:hypothetical protein